jgi:4-amino-4-deoxy-L-arabinose transferase-like glycosyltransferase
MKSKNLRMDAGCICLILLLSTMVFVVRNSAVPMQIWDESRNANNAFEMSMDGLSLVTRFHGSADHWSTKPPLLIWLIVMCLRVGVQPLMAVRLPSIVTAIGTVFTVFLFARIYLNDRFAGFISALTLLASPLFVGWHTGRTGDYDGLVVFFTFTYSLAFWRYIESEGRPEGRWVCLAAVALSLDVLTKGIGGALVLPALLLYAAIRGRLRFLLQDRQMWLALLGVIVVAASYYALRERYDPGYLAAVWSNEFTGRYLVANESHSGRLSYYPGVLLGKFEPGLLLLPLAVIPLFKANRLRFSIVLFCVLVSAFFFTVLSGSKTKIFWYLAPITPFLAVSVGLGVSDTFAWLREQSRLRGAVTQLRVAYLMLFAVYGTANLGIIYYYQIGVEKKLANVYMGGRYGPFLESVRLSNLTQNVIVLDDGSSEALGHYSPEADFFAEVERSRGMHVRVAVPGGNLLPGTWVASCDPRSKAWLAENYRLATVLQSQPWCVLELTQGPRLPSAQRQGAL